MAKEPQLDRTDFAILRLLMKNARLSNKEIAAAVGLAPSSCHERMKSLKACGILLGAHAEVDLRALGLNLEAFLFVQLGKLSRETVDRFLKSTAEVLEVRSVSLVSGHSDLIVRVAVRDMEHLKDLISVNFNRHDVVVRTETCIVFSHTDRYAMPLAQNETMLDEPTPLLRDEKRFYQ
jgi:DNA-binding Lrp family transcriptional regulator